MSSTAITVTSPVANPTSVQLAQVAANISSTVFTNCQNDRTIENLYGLFRLLALAIDCLGQSLLTINNSTASSVGTVQVNTHYALGANAVIPTTMMV